MAERVNAFKTKYTGEQIEELFDKLANYTSDVPSAGEGQYYSTEVQFIDGRSGNWLKSQTIETNFGFLSFTGLTDTTGMSLTDNLLSLLSSANTSGIYLGSEKTTLIYTFKKPVILLRHRCSASASGTLYYWINDEWVSQGTANYYGTELTNSQPVTKVKIEYPPYINGVLNYSIFDFMSDEYIISGPAIKDRGE